MLDRSSLSSLNDNELWTRLPELCRREHEGTLDILLHLNEVERRRLHLKRGYSSMFVYCISCLGYSEPAAFRRIRTARCVARFPEIHAMLQANDVNLSTIARASRVLTADNKDALLARIRGRSRREVEAITAEYEPLLKCRDIVRPVAVRVPPVLGSLELSLRADANPDPDASRNARETPGNENSPLSDARVDASGGERACEKSDYLRREGDSHPTPSTEKRVQFQFTARETFQDKFEKIRTLAWHRLPANASLEQVFEVVMDEFIQKHDPRAKRARREKRVNSAVRPKQSRPNPLANQRTRHIAAAIKDDVFVRDNAQCTFVGTDGRRCGETRNLHLDHITPKACNGSNEVNNLRLLCAQHNQLVAERVFGSKFMTQYRKL